ncbi:hypothetical protein BJ741DRAFT_626155 [Chytriomyces cf. hyalinus JEL632]|nr:hypothetical protein BJ741DRAFT_626155 [Chytriomyces cf. hyalinus JEL632]
MTRITVLPGQRIQQASAPLKAQQQAPAAPRQQQKAAPLSKPDSATHYRGKENSPPSNKLSQPPKQAMASNPNAKVQAAPLKASAPPTPAKLSTAQSKAHPDWCTDDKSMHELNSEEDELWYMQYLFGAPPSPTKQSAKPATRSNKTNYKARIIVALKAPRAARQQVRRRQTGKKSQQLSQKESQEIRQFVNTLFSGSSKSKTNWKLRIAHAKKCPVVRGHKRAQQAKKRPASPAEKAEIQRFVNSLFDSPNKAKQQQPIRQQQQRAKTNFRARVFASLHCARVPKSELSRRAPRPKVALTQQEKTEIAQFVRTLFNTGGPAKAATAAVPKTSFQLQLNNTSKVQRRGWRVRLAIALKAPRVPRQQLQRRIKSRKQLTLAERKEISEFCDSLFSSSGVTARQRGGTAKSNWKLRQAIALKAQRVPRNQLKRRLRVRKALSDTEKNEINSFCDSLFMTQRDRWAAKKKLTTQERNEICQFVNNLFVYPKVQAARRNVRDNQIVFLHEHEKEYLRSEVFKMWAAAQPNWGQSRHQNGPYPQRDRAQQRRAVRQEKKAARDRKALRLRRAAAK